MAADATRAPVAREQELAPGVQPRLSPAEIDRALRSGPRVTPSHTDAWYGRPQPGSRWTAPQNHTLRTELEKARASSERWAPGAVERLKDPERVKPFRVERQVFPQGNPTLKPVYRIFNCPLIAISQNGRRALIIAPGGDKMWVDAGGKGDAAADLSHLAGAVIGCWLIAALGLWVLA